MKFITIQLKWVATMTVTAFLIMTSVPVFAGGTHGTTGGTHGVVQGTGTAGKAKDVTRTIEITMNDNYYEPEVINVKEDETVRFVIKNTGLLVHEFNLGTQAMHTAHQQEMLMMVQHGALLPDRIDQHKMLMDMGNGNVMKHDDPNSILLEPGISGEVIWKFAKTNEIEFACNVPGHYQAGMVGEIKVN